MFVCHRREYYTLDDDGWILADNRGKLVIKDMRKLIDIYLLQHIFADNIKTAAKDDMDNVIGILNER